MCIRDRAWSEYAEGMFGEIDVEGKRTFTEFIREGAVSYTNLGFIPVRWWKKQEAVLQKVLLLYPDAMYVM